jgi:kinesin family protein 11
MAHLDTQLHSLDDIVSRIREQNNVHHTAHTASLATLSTTVQASYSSIGDHLSSSFDRVQSLESDVSAQNGTLKETLSSLAADADIRAPLHELREAVGNQNLIEYSPTGETPQRVNYNIPSNLPRTESHDTILSRLRDRSASADDTTRSPSKQPIFNDATNSIPSPTDTFTFGKPDFARSMSANNHTMPASLRELDVNIVAQESHTQPLPLVSQSSDSLAMDVPPNKKQRPNDDGSKLPMKKMRKTVGDAKGDRENLTMTDFSSSIENGLVGVRKLRSHGST